jgi:Tol biopolymer transport system component
MRATLAIGILLLGTTSACGPSPGAPRDADPVSVVPALESVPFELLGSGKIAFQRIGEGGRFSTIYVIDASARTSAHYFDHLVIEGAAISPDGRRLAYAAYAGSTTLYDSYVANIDGTGVVHISTFAAQEGPPTWTPDGTKILILGGSGLGPYQVYSQSPVASPPDRTQLTHFAYPSGGGELTCPIIDDNNARVSISSQGLLAFDCFWKEIDVLASNGTPLASYAPPRVDGSKWPNVVGAAWSPDGTRVAFIEATSDNVTTHKMLSMALKVMNADGSNITTVVSRPMSNVQFGGGWAGFANYSMCWTADGSRLVFNIPESELVGHLWVVGADGSGLAQLTSAPDAWDRSVSCTRS